MWCGRFTEQSDTLGGLILIALTLSVLFCHVLSKICRAKKKKCFVLIFCFVVPIQQFPGALCCCCCRVIFFLEKSVSTRERFWLVAEPNFFFVPSQHVLPSRRQTDRTTNSLSHISPKKLTRRLHAANKSILYQLHLECHTGECSSFKRV